MAPRNNFFGEVDSPPTPHFCDYGAARGVSWELRNVSFAKLTVVSRALSSCSTAIGEYGSWGESETKDSRKKRAYVSKDTLITCKLCKLETIRWFFTAS